MGNMVYGLPFGLNAEFLCYNKTIWDKAGLTAVKGWDDATWTWDAWLEAAKKTTTRVGDQTDVFGALSPVDNARTAQMFGGYFASPDLTKITFDTPEAIKGYVFRQGNIWTDRVTPNAGESAALATGFLSGKVGMVMQGTWGVGGYLDITDFEWDFLPIPFASEVGVEALRASPYWPDSLAISSVKNGQQSWDLISWMVLEKENYKEFTQLMSMVPARKGFRAEFYENWKTKGAGKNWSIIEENFGHASTDRSLLNANWQEALQVFNSGIEAITTNEAQAVDVIPELAKAVAEPWQLGLDMIS
jgi:multiple sugar transport system substrate-binding protein